MREAYIQRRHLALRIVTERQRSPGRGATRWFQATPDPRLRVQRIVIPDFPARPHGDSPDRSLAWEHDTDSTELSPVGDHVRPVIARIIMPDGLTCNLRTEDRQFRCR